MKRLDNLDQELSRVLEVSRQPNKLDGSVEGLLIAIKSIPDGHRESLIENARRRFKIDLEQFDIGQDTNKPSLKRLRKRTRKMLAGFLDSELKKQQWSVLDISQTKEGRQEAEPERKEEPLQQNLNDQVDKMLDPGEEPRQVQPLAVTPPPAPEPMHRPAHCQIPRPMQIQQPLNMAPPMNRAPRQDFMPRLPHHQQKPVFYPKDR